MTILPSTYYQHEDVLFLSRDLLGKFLVTKIQGELTSGMIVETEAYRSFEDKASHASEKRRTRRNEVMYHSGGKCYVYLCYGIHSIFNIVTNTAEIPDGVMIRSIEPSEGIEKMLKRRKKLKLDKTLTNGPGAVTQALGITTAHNGLLLKGPLIWLEDRGIKVKDEEILSSPRIGIDYAQEHANLLWRFGIKGNPWVSRK